MTNHCDWCNGTGDGMTEGARCRRCRGMGVVEYWDSESYDAWVDEQIDKKKDEKAEAGYERE
jgi:DnaJ-class molecular chaperone